MASLDLTTASPAAERGERLAQRTRILCVLFFFSGFPALIYQLTWQRALFLIFGVNIESVTIVVTAFMLGLGVGSLAGGWLSKRQDIPLLPLLAAIELLTGAFRRCGAGARHHPYIAHGCDPSSARQPSCPLLWETRKRSRTALLRQYVGSRRSLPCMRPPAVPIPWNERFDLCRRRCEWHRRVWRDCHTSVRPCRRITPRTGCCGHARGPRPQAKDRLGICCRRRIYLAFI